jgi:hypothetical protein
MTKAAQSGYIAAFSLGARRVSERDAILSLPRYLITEDDKGKRFEAILGVGESEDPTYAGTVVDSETGHVIEGASATLDNNVVLTDRTGSFHISGEGSLIRVRAPGYLRRDVDGGQSGPLPIKVELQPFKPKALYLSFFGIGSAALREPALKLIDETELNALVIDVKGDRGMISFRTSIPLGEAAGAEKETTIRDVHQLLAALKQKNIYTIARIVVFKDEPLATARHDLAVKLSNGEVWHDREGLAWTDPFNAEVRDYNIDVAVEAAKAGFDEIQFDYVRFPDARGLVFSMKETEENRL